jgi:hypothetical protein
MYCSIAIGSSIAVHFWRGTAVLFDGRITYNTLSSFATAFWDGGISQFLDHHDFGLLLRWRSV